jgi:hypothetical protein
MDRRGVASTSPRGLFSSEFGRFDIERASGMGRSLSVDARGVEKTSTGRSCSEGGVGNTGEGLAEASRGSRAYSSLKMSGFGIRIDGNCGSDSLVGEVEGCSRASGAMFPLAAHPHLAQLPQVVLAGSKQPQKNDSTDDRA